MRGHRVGSENTDLLDERPIFPAKQVCSVMTFNRVILGTSKVEVYIHTPSRSRNTYMHQDARTDAVHPWYNLTGCPNQALHVVTCYLCDHRSDTCCMSMLYIPKVELAELWIGQHCTRCEHLRVGSCAAMSVNELPEWQVRLIHHRRRNV
jgi:hypothetical protein